jgi:hypothetical protein
MTTHDQQTDTAASTAEVTSSPGADAPTGTESSTEQAEPSTPETEPSTPGTETPTEESLFAEGELSGLRSRWDDIQSAFVDDPRECVQKADALVSDVVDQLTTGFTEARSRLEAQWARGEQASTEDLRLALKRYREFFQRLLAV